MHVKLPCSCFFVVKLDLLLARRTTDYLTDLQTPWTLQRVWPRGISQGASPRLAWYRWNMSEKWKQEEMWGCAGTALQKSFQYSDIKIRLTALRPMYLWQSFTNIHQRCELWLGCMFKAPNNNNTLTYAPCSTPNVNPNPFSHEHCAPSRDARKCWPWYPSVCCSFGKTSWLVYQS